MQCRYFKLLNKFLKEISQNVSRIGKNEFFSSTRIGEKYWLSTQQKAQTRLILVKEIIIRFSLPSTSQRDRAFQKLSSEKQKKIVPYPDHSQDCLAAK